MAVAQFLALVTQLALVLGVLLAFRLEELHGLDRIVPVVAAGFVVHAWLPRRLQQPFFSLLSFAGLVAVLGLERGGQVIAMGLGLLGLCHLPVPARIRIAVLVLAGAGLAVLRQYGDSRWVAAVFPILGSMFMFRIIVYLYDTSHERTPSSFWERISYFFLLPNTIFPIFPIVDYATFRRTYFDAPAVEVYQRGLRRMLRGTTHLLLYRVIYQHWTPSPDGVHDLAGLLQMMVTSYCQLLRISGQFHLAVGVLGLFGFDLPRTQFFYFLASSFTDYWRRANIYWRDFMVKLFLNPAYVRLRRRGFRQPLLLATLWVFLASWVLHSYQWYWLLGSFPVKFSDFVFWGLFGIAVAWNGLWETKHRRRARPGPPSWGASVRHGLQVVGVFSFVCVLWSFWTTESVEAWLALLAQGRNTTPAELAGFAVLLAGVVAALALAHRRAKGERRQGLPAPTPALAGVGTALLAAVLLALATPPVQGALGPHASRWLADISEPGLNRADRDRFVAGYYAELQGSHHLGSPMWDWVGLNRQRGKVQSRLLTEPVDEPIGQRMRPGVHIETAEGTVSTNRWGMRDRDYEREPAPGTFRIAIHGASPEVGTGVQDSDVFEARLEDALNREYAGKRFTRYEVLNFAVVGHRPLDYEYMLRTTSLAFRPNLVAYMAHDSENTRLINDIEEWLAAGYEPGGRLGELLRERGISADMDSRILGRRLWYHWQPVVAAFYRDFVETARAGGATPVWIFVRLAHNAARSDRPDTEVLAREAGFITLVVPDLFAGQDPGEFLINRSDFHPNPRAHAMIAEALLEQFRQHDRELGTGLEGDDG